MHRRATGAGLAGLALVALSCAGDPGVHTEQALDVDGPPTSPAVPSPEPLDWTDCPPFDVVTTVRWECAWVEVPIDRANPSVGTVTVALTRPELPDGDERRPLVINPGGPGAPGTALAPLLIDALPPELLDSFYPVGWDPRGVGLSEPAIDCGSDPDALNVSQCRSRTGALLGHVGAADAALDLEEVRAALDVERLDYLGYSYGTALGAVYAMAYPDHVGHFVLDGAIAPDAGDPAKPVGGHDTPWYAADEIDDVVARFHELCAASPACAAGPDSRALVDSLEETIRTLPTAHFDGEPEQLGRLDVEDVMYGITYEPDTWSMAADALGDAAAGDASTLAAFSSAMLNGFPGDPATQPDSDEFLAANFAIHCADFSAMDDVWGCEQMPAALPLPVISSVDVATPILVIGTQFDPATPGHHAAEMAAALGDAVAVMWEGVGHTAFPGTTCLDELVVDHLVHGRVPAAGATCPFVDGASTDAETADALFKFRPWDVEPRLEGVLVAAGVDGRQARCESVRLAVAGHRVITHLLLGVTSDAAAAAETAATAAC